MRHRVDEEDVGVVLRDRLLEVRAVEAPAAEDVLLAAAQALQVAGGLVVGDLDVHDRLGDGGDVQAGGGERLDEGRQDAGVDGVPAPLELQQARDQRQRVADGG